MLLFNVYSANFFTGYGFSLMLLNIFFYFFLLTGVFSIFFLFDSNRLKTLSDLKGLSVFPFVSLSFFLILASLAGLPPLSGFSAKLLTFMFLFLCNNFLTLFFFIIVSFFFLFFYIQNVRLLTTNSDCGLFLFYKTSHRSKFLAFLICTLLLLNFFNLFAAFFLEDFVLLCNYMFSCM